MQFDLDQRSIALSVGAFADFFIGPRDSMDGPQGLWRAQLGTRWHKDLRAQLEKLDATALFEVPISGSFFHRGWTIKLTGRIDQITTVGTVTTLREVKTVLCALPSPESELRAEHPSYFVQAAVYLSVYRSLQAEHSPVAAMLVFVEAGSGLLQNVAIEPGDKSLVDAQLDRVADFLEERLRSRNRLRNLRVRPPFSEFRPGQEEALGKLSQALKTCHSALLFEAPTGFGKTGILLEAALAQLAEGHFERLIYLTSKSTGQLQVVRTLEAMTGTHEPQSLESKSSVLEPPSTWIVRPKSEHCINSVFQCIRDLCPYLRNLATKWERKGLGRILSDPHSARDIESLRLLGEEAVVCPHEITRAALPFADIWIGDFNYVFSPSTRSFFLEQPGFLANRCLLLIDEAHNLPSRAADAYSHQFSGEEALDVLDALRAQRIHISLLQTWDHWTHFLRHLPAHKSLPLADEDDARHLLEQLSQQLLTTPLDYAALGPKVSEQLWKCAELIEQLKTSSELHRHWWCPRPAQLSITCIDASQAIGETLRDFGAVILASATFGPHETFAQAIGLAPEAVSKTQRSMAEVKADLAQSSLMPEGKLGDLSKLKTRKLLTQITRGSDLLRVEERIASASLTGIQATAPWRDGAYRVAIDLRVDTRFQHRDHFYSATANTLCDWQRLSGIQEPGLAVFFPSYAYAEAILKTLANEGLQLRTALQPRRSELREQAAWVERSLAETDALFLVLGSSFAESIDLLGGRVRRALVVGPALPEVNPIQQAKLDALASLGREAAFRRVYQVPGMQKVNQALGRLVRAPGQTASILLHCYRFADTSYAQLLSPEYQQSTRIDSDDTFTAWALRSEQKA